MAYSPVHLAAINDACSQLYQRNRREVDSFQEVVEGYYRYLQQATELQQRSEAQERELVVLREQKDKLAAQLQENAKSAVKAPELASLREKVEQLQHELAQSYRSHSQAAQQLLQSSSTLQAVKEDAERKSRLVMELEERLEAARAKIAHLEELLQQKDAAVELAAAEAASCRREVEALQEQLGQMEEENRGLIERWMEQKMKEAERINEANAIYEDMMERSKAGRLEALARRQVDGIVRSSEAGADAFVAVGLPTGTRCHTVRAHEGGCSALAFDVTGRRLVSGGHDRLGKVWEVTTRGTQLAAASTLRGCLGAVLDLAWAQDNKMLLGASSDHKLYLWDIDSGRVRHSLTGHTEKVVTADVNKVVANRAASAAHDRTIKVWDLDRGYGINTVVCHSNCNALCFTSDGTAVCTGHMDGNLRLWDMRSARLANEVAAHASGITSVVLARSGHSVVTCGRDNVVNIFDVRTFEVRASLRAPAFRVATNWSRVCLSPDEQYVAAGSADGTVLIWSESNRTLERTLRGHDSSVVACAWSDCGRPLATADKTGSVVIWQ